MDVKGVKIDELAAECVSIIGEAIDYITVQAAERIGMDVEQPPWKTKSNITLQIDKGTHNLCSARLTNMLREQFGIANVAVIGEEIKSKGSEPGHWQDYDLVIALDAVDGTDLVARGLGNWCTALFLFEPKKPRIIASFVGVPPGVVYFAYDSCGIAMKQNTEQHPSNFKKTRPVDVRKWREKRLTIDSASVCFYGQKPGNFLSVFRNPGLLETLLRLRSGMEDKGYRFRIYNLGGNPMMVNLADGKIDAVIELEGQKLYDVIPGVYIAQKAGAFLGDLEGNEINEEYWKKPLANPEQSTLSYILASTSSLYKDLLACLRA